MDAIKTILLHLDASDRTPARLAVATALADRYDATVKAVYAVTPSAMHVAAMAEGSSMFYDTARQLDEQYLQHARELFTSASAGPRVTWAQLNDLPMVPAFVRQALVVDLLVLGQYDRGRPGSQATPVDFVESVIIDSGKPALVVPYAGEFPQIGRIVFVAWKPTRESARALWASLPLLEQAEQVHVASWGDDDPREVGHLMLRHGIDAQWHHEPAGGPPLGDAMLSRAADFGADLLVMGCYGHGRTRELVLGGASRTVLDSMTLPVLMAH